ncbi:MAG TPA: hypothetical protein VE262_26115 [Blastocatellia bacterium]|nr:hypothetical protein [Blastocatellia bacterium]
MMKMKRAVIMAVLALAVAALALPVVGLRARAAGGPVAAKPSAAVASRAIAPAPTAAAATTKQATVADESVVQAQLGKTSQEVIDTLGYKKVPSAALGELNARIADSIRQRISGGAQPLSGQPLVLNPNSALSAGLITTIGGRDNQFSEVALIADWDGREDCVADRENKVDDFSFAELEIDFVLTRAAISEHTVANGFAENVFYYGDSVGNLWIGTDAGADADANVNTVVQVNIPTLVNTGASGGFTLLEPEAGDCTDDQVTVTGIAVNPVADLGDFGLCGTIGEVIYVSVSDTEGCASNAANQIFRTRIFAFAVTDTVGGVAPAGVRQILRSPLHNVAGVTVDDDGSLYFQLADLISFSGAAIFKATEVCGNSVGCTVPGTNPRVNRVIPNIPGGATGFGGTVGLTLSQASAITDDGDAVVEPGERVRLTNFSGNSTTFGNVVAMDAGPCNVLYAAVSRSNVDGTDNTTGLFNNPAGLGATPSMIISFADCGGFFDPCTAIGGFPGILPVADGIADGVASGTLAATAGVNNFRVFALGTGPDIPRTGTNAAIITPNTLKLDFQVDFQSHAGIAVNEEGTVFVISGGAPGGPGKNPSPMLGEILCFEDMCPMDRIADPVDMRTTGTLPNPPAPAANVGDGVSDRADHIFYQSPLDQVTLTPGGLSGLATGFLRYTNRLAPGLLGPGVALGVTQRTQTDDDTDGTIIFENLDPGHQVAGGDDQNTPFRGDDNNGAGTPPLVGQFEGGFEFLFGGPVASCVWNGFFLNSNGNITFGGGDTDNFANVLDFRAGLPRIAPAWTDLNPAARAVNLCNFPVQALGFANVNAFKIRWINVPEFGLEGCTATQINGGRSNTFAVTLYDDGRLRDENEAQVLDPADPTGDNIDPAFDEQEGPTDLRFTREPVTGILVGCPPRRDGTGHFIFEYCRMDLLGVPVNPVLVGYSIGGLSPLNPPGLCEVGLGGLGEAARAAEQPAPTGFGVFAGQTGIIAPCLIGEGTEPTIFELFNEGADPSIDSGGVPTFATADFDLRFEGNGNCTPPARQDDLNRGKVGFFGIGCLPPPAPDCVLVNVPTFAVTPGGNSATDIVDALCAVPLNILGCGFFPNEVTTVCQVFAGETGVNPQRAGKTVTTAVALTCDTNGDGIPEATLPLVTVNPRNPNLIQATIPTVGIGNATAAQTSSGFPLACCGGTGTLTVTTTFTAGDNNVFGPFTRTVTCPLPLGTRAPVVISVTPSSGDCAVPQDLIITGACFLSPTGAPAVTSVFAIERGTTNRIDATRFVVLGNDRLDAFFNFGTANAGRTFLIFVQGPGGISRNLTSLPAGAPANCPLGNELGVPVTFTCSTGSGGGGDGGDTVNIAVVNGCRLDRSATGKFTLQVTGSNIRPSATLTINGSAPRKLKFKDLQSGTNTFNRIVAIGRLCALLPGDIVVTNPGARASAPFRCNQACPTN